MDNDDSAIIEVTVERSEWKLHVTEIEQFATRIVRGTLDRSDEVPPGQLEVSVVFSDDATIRDLNARFRGKDTPTNVLSFPGYDAEAPFVGSVLLGDIVLAMETIEREAADQNKAFQDHLAHLLIHGTLHLLGLDHQDDDQADHMERTETRIMTHLGFGDPYAISEEAV